MKYHTRTKWADGDMTVSELPFDSIKAAAEAVVSEGDTTPLSGTPSGYVFQLFVLLEDESGFAIRLEDCTQALTWACYDYWCAKYEANYCLNGDVPKLIEDLVDERFVLDVTGDYYVIRKGME